MSDSLIAYQLCTEVMHWGRYQIIVGEYGYLPPCIIPSLHGQKIMSARYKGDTCIGIMHINKDKDKTQQNVGCEELNWNQFDFRPGEKHCWQLFLTDF